MARAISQEPFAGDLIPARRRARAAGDGAPLESPVAHNLHFIPVFVVAEDVAGAQGLLVVLVKLAQGVPADDGRVIGRQ